MDKLSEIKRELNRAASPIKAKLLRRYFKTGKGEYGYGDIFIGVTVPVIRKISRKHKDIGLNIVEKLIHSRIHEERLLGLLILTSKYQAADESEKYTLCRFYLNNRSHINNWDLVDLTAHKILGDYIFKRNRNILDKLIKSKNIWDRRIAILATFYFISKNDFKDSFRLAKILINDEHDLIHKAVGWMLREIGKRDLESEELFLLKNYKKMPRTMLRYAIEKFPEKKRLAYLHNEV